jgi:hypothetical protein
MLQYTKFFAKVFWYAEWIIGTTFMYFLFNNTDILPRDKGTHTIGT